MNHSMLSEDKRDALQEIVNIGMGAAGAALAEVLGAFVELRYKQKFGLLILDIDHFKKINDTHGHLVGDEAIKHVAQRAVATLRTTDVVARYGGEEFVVFLPGEDVEGAALAAERLREAARKPFKTLAEVDLTLTISLGVTGFRPEVTDPKVLLGEADRALYASKEGGRNRVSVFRPDAPESAEKMAK